MKHSVVVEGQSISTRPGEANRADGPVAGYRGGEWGVEFGMNSSIPFIRIADRVEVTVDLTGSESVGLRYSFDSDQPSFTL